MLLTHGHQDHVGDLHLLRTAYPEAHAILAPKGSGQVVVRKRRAGNLNHSQAKRAAKRWQKGLEGGLTS